MYPKNGRYSDMYDDFEDNFYETFDGESYYDEDDMEDRSVGRFYDGMLYDSDYDYGISNKDIADVCSFTECTGMVSRGTAEEDELSEFREMYNFGGPNANH